ncbi:MAG: helix-turn-helix domain-containing protein [Puniceicoccales bacterium]|jgi:transposase|nr:helix-turn-helix domain-containing protein [Puniceicoccales bacterium]
MNVEREIQTIDREARKLAKKKEALLRLRQEDSEKEQKLNSIYAESGYSTPVDLVEALIRRFGLRVSGDNSFQKKRKRTRVTGALRDTIRKECKECGMSMNAVSKKYGVSYAVVSKILSGFYDGRE